MASQPRIATKRKINVLTKLKKKLDRLKNDTTLTGKYEEMIKSRVRGKN